MFSRVARHKRSILHLSTIANPITSFRRFHRTSFMADSNGDAGTAPAEQPLPKLSTSDFKEYNRMAEMMDVFVSRQNLSLTP